MISNSQRFICEILKVAGQLGKKLFSFGPLRFKIQKDYDSETSEFKIHSFRVFQRYLTYKSGPNRSRNSITFFNSVHVVFESTLVSSSTQEVSKAFQGERQIPPPFYNQKLGKIAIQPLDLENTAKSIFSTIYDSVWRLFNIQNNV